MTQTPYSDIRNEVELETLKYRVEVIGYQITGVSN